MASRKTPECHPSRPYYAKLKCRACYEHDLRHGNAEYWQRQRENARRWAKKFPERIKAKQRERIEDPRCRARDKSTKRRAWLADLGTTESELAALLEFQRGACAICRRSFSEATQHVDHDHATGELRGLLCSRCNNGLGMFGDGKEGLEVAIRYLDFTSLMQLRSGS